MTEKDLGAKIRATTLARTGLNSTSDTRRYTPLGPPHQKCLGSIAAANGISPRVTVRTTPSEIGGCEEDFMRFRRTDRGLSYGKMHMVNLRGPRRKYSDDPAPELCAGPASPRHPRKTFAKKQAAKELHRWPNSIWSELGHAGAVPGQAFPLRLKTRQTSLIPASGGLDAAREQIKRRGSTQGRAEGQKDPAIATGIGQWFVG